MDHSIHKSIKIIYEFIIAFIILPMQMLFNEDDWKNVNESDETYIISKSETKSHKHAKIGIVSNILKIFSALINTELKTEYFLVKKINEEKLIKNKITLIKQHLMSFTELRNDNTLFKIIFFKILIFLQIPSRILILVNDKNVSISYIEIVDGAVVIKDPFVIKKVEDSVLSKGFVISLDTNYKIIDHSIYYTTDLKHYRFFVEKIFKSIIFYEKIIGQKIAENIENKINAIELGKYNFLTLDLNTNKEFYQNGYDELSKLDSKRLSVIPQSKIKIKYHPLYIIESLLNHNQLIHPKRPILGYFKGEAVYYRKNLITLYNEKQLYRLGMKVKDDEKLPYRVHKSSKKLKTDQNNIKKGSYVDKNDNIVEKTNLYGPWQTCEIYWETLSDLIDSMPPNHRYVYYFHQNHIPRDSIFLNNQLAGEICHMMGISYRETISSFYRTAPIVSGVIFEKQYFDIVSGFLLEHTLSLELKNRLYWIEKSLYNWKKFIKKLKIYHKACKRLEIEQ